MNCLTFCHASAMLMRDIAIGGVFVCVSICLSHAGIDSKLITIGSCSVHNWAGQDSFFESRFCT